MIELRCHAPSGPRGRRCDAELGRPDAELRIIGVFNRWESEEERSDSREVWHCETCGWYNLFEPATNRRQSSA